MSSWQDANIATSSIQIKTWRIVEDQSKSTTRKFVDSSFEHDLLEALLDQNKPKVKYYNDERYFHHLHYLLSTPFRYPPLKWGSRFGTKLERSLLYTAANLETAMAEKAYYKLAFYQGSDAILGGKTPVLTAFEIKISSESYVNLTTTPFNQYTTDISSKTSYETSQALGSKMRTKEIECFQYQSARCLKKGRNFAIFTPKVLQNNRDLESTFRYLNCYSTKENVEYSYKNGPQHNTYSFSIKAFEVDGKFPFPPA